MKTFLQKYFLTLTIVLSGAFLLLLWVKVGTQYTPDSDTYRSAWEVLKSGQLDIRRTPSYPLTYGLFTLISWKYAISLTVLLQILVFLYSIKSFWFISNRLVPNRKVAMMGTLFYALAPGINTFCILLLTESLAMSGMVILLELLLRMSDKWRIRYAVAYALLFLYLIFLRPALLYMCVVLGVLFLYWLYQKRVKLAVTTLLPLCVSVLLLWGYARRMQSQTGIFMITRIEFVNYLHTMKRNGLFDKISFKERHYQDIHHRLNQMDADDFRKKIPATPVEEQYTLYDYARKAKAQFGIRWYWYAYLRALESANQPFLRSYVFPIKSFQLIRMILPFKLYAAYVALLFYLLVQIYLLVSRRTVNWVNWILCLAGLGNVAVMTIGSFDEWSRLILPSVPFILLIMMQIISSVDFNKYLSVCSKSRL
jgi:hypothetical protein